MLKKMKEKCVAEARKKLTESDFSLAQVLLNVGLKQQQHQQQQQQQQHSESEDDEEGEYNDDGEDELVSQQQDVQQHQDAMQLDDDEEEDNEEQQEEDQVDDENYEEEEEEEEDNYEYDDDSDDQDYRPTRKSSSTNTKRTSRKTSTSRGKTTNTTASEAPVDTGYCSCCGNKIMSLISMRYATNAQYYKQIFPESKDGRVCRSCYEKMRAHKTNATGELCSCCKSGLGKKHFKYESQSDLYQELFPGSPFGEGSKVCQSCYYRAKALQDKQTGDSCACCERTLGSRPQKYEKYAELYAEIFPKSPIGNSGRVCRYCYRRVQMLKNNKEGDKCACCTQKLENGHVHRYRRHEQTYKELFPDSPHENTEKVCHTCYTKAVKRSKQIAKEKDDQKKKLKQQSDVTDESDDQKDENGNMVCCCCTKPITGMVLKYSTYAHYYKKLFPDSQEGKVCRSCYDSCIKYRAQVNGEFCACCKGELGRIINLFETHSELYKRLSTDAPHGASGKVCQSCYTKAKTLKHQEDGENCACCTGQLGTCPTLYKTYSEFYKELFPDSPHGSNNHKVCQNCYKKALVLRSEKAGESCACCRGRLGAQRLRYEGYAQIYSELFPGSPYGTLGKVCMNCYQKANKRSKELKAIESGQPIPPKKTYNKRRKSNDTTQQPTTAVSQSASTTTVLGKRANPFPPSQQVPDKIQRTDSITTTTLITMTTSNQTL
jgi:hypothetical protein